MSLIKAAYIFKEIKHHFSNSTAFISGYVIKGFEASFPVLHTKEQSGNENLGHMNAIETRLQAMR